MHGHIYIYIYSTLIVKLFLSNGHHFCIGACTVIIEQGLPDNYRDIKPSTYSNPATLAYKWGPDYHATSVPGLAVTKKMRDCPSTVLMAYGGLDLLLAQRRRCVCPAWCPGSSPEGLVR